MNLPSNFDIVRKLYSRPEDSGALGEVMKEYRRRNPAGVDLVHLAKVAEDEAAREKRALDSGAST